MPEMKLDGKVAVVTGAGSRGDGIGNGRAAAILLAREGVHVALLDSNQDWVEHTHSLIKSEGGSSHVINADVTNSSSCANAIYQTVQLWGRLDILVNNVGISGPPGNSIEVDPDEWDFAMRINVTSMMLMAKYAIPEMIKQSRGVVINTASIDGLRGGNPNLMYNASKGAVVNLTRGMATHHGPQGIRVNCIAPGYVYTPMVAERGMTDELREKRSKNNLLQKEGTGWDIGKGVVFLASDQASWITGVILSIDGGSMAGSLNSVTVVQ